MQLIGASIDLSKIDKSQIIEGKNGAKYYNFTIIVNDQPDKYGKDVSLTLPQTKEDRVNKKPKTFIGNGKTLFKTGHNSVTSEDTPQYKSKNNDLPF